jgi:hypothetical protein
MLSSSDGTDGPLIVQSIGKWDEDGIDVGIGEKFLEARR